MDSSLGITLPGTPPLNFFYLFIWMSTRVCITFTSWTFISGLNGTAVPARLAPREVGGTGLIHTRSLGVISLRDLCSGG